MTSRTGTAFSAAMRSGFPRRGIYLARPVAFRLLPAVGADDLFVATLYELLELLFARRTSVL